MVTFTGLGMTVIMVEVLAQAVFVFGAVLCVVVIDIAIDDFDILAIVDDFEGSELYIAEMDTNDFSLTDTLDEGVIFIEESLPEVLYRLVGQSSGDGRVMVMLLAASACNYARKGENANNAPSLRC